MKKSLMERKVDALAEIILDCPEIPDAAKGKLRELMSKSGRPGGITATEIVAKVGVPSSVMGFRYAVFAIDTVVNNPDILQTVTKRLYPAVAAQFNTTPSRVERAIRHAIELSWNRCDLETQQAYFGPSVDLKKGKPTSTEFISRLADYVRGDLVL